MHLDMLFFAGVVHKQLGIFHASIGPFKALHPLQPQKSRRLRINCAAMQRKRHFVNDMRDDVLPDVEFLFLEQSSALHQSLAVWQHRI